MWVWAQERGTSWELTLITCPLPSLRASGEKRMLWEPIESWCRGGRSSHWHL